jgi:hypothetical protein
MKIRKVKMLVLVMASTLLILAACANNTVPSSDVAPPTTTATTDEPLSAEQPQSYEIGQVSVISGGAEYEPYEHMSSAGVIVDGQMVDGVGTYLSLEEVSASLPEIPYADGFQVIVEGKDAESTTYSLYSDGFESLYSYQNDLSIPTEEGIYLLGVAVTWSNGETDPQHKEYRLNEYFFKVRV